MFHRLAIPSYFGGLPGGYDYINNAVSGTPAFADGQKGGGPNVGSYFIAFGEDATSADANRPALALAQNTDFLDDLMHRDLALPVRLDGTAVGPVPSILITGPGVFMGGIGDTLEDLFHLTDQNGDDIVVGGTKVVVTSAVDSGLVVVGGGFSLGNVTVTFNLSIPDTTLYSLYYGERTNLATLPADFLTTMRIRSTIAVDAQVEEVFAAIQGPISAGIPWNAAPTTTLYDLAWGGLDERYRHATAKDVGYPAYHPAANALDTAGAGGWFTRTTAGGPGVTGYSTIASAGPTSFGTSEHVLGGLWGSVLQDQVAVAAAGDRAAVSAGFVALGGRITTETEPFLNTPGMFGFYAGSRRVTTGASLTTRTVLSAGASVTLNAAGLVLNGPNDHFYILESLVPMSAFAQGVDIIRLNVGGVLYNVTMLSLSSALAGTMAFLDGSTPNFPPATAATIVEWVRTEMFTSDGGAGYRALKLGLPAPTTDFRGFFWSSLPNASVSAVNDSEYARFFARSDDGTSAAFAWGGYNQSGGIASGFKYIEYSYLLGDGSANILGALDVFGNATFGPSSAVSVQDTLDVFGTLTAHGAANFDGAVEFNSSGAHVPLAKDGFEVTKGLDVAFIRSGLHEVTGGSAPVINLATSGSNGGIIRWLLDGTNPVGASTVGMTFNNFAYASTSGINYDSGRLTVAIRRTNTSRVNGVSFTVTGYTSVFSGTDALLSPIGDGAATYYWDVYEGVVAKDRVFWSVTRYTE
jgi:hypothetical protein